MFLFIFTWLGIDCMKCQYIGKPNVIESQATNPVHYVFSFDNSKSSYRYQLWQCLKASVLHRNKKKKNDVTSNIMTVIVFYKVYILCQ